MIFRSRRHHVALAHSASTKTCHLMYLKADGRNPLPVRHLALRVLPCLCKRLFAETNSRIQALAAFTSH